MLVFVFDDFRGTSPSGRGYTLQQRGGDTMLSVIKLLAEREGETPENVYAEMQRAITLAWADPKNRRAIIRLTGIKTCPTVEQFITAAANKVSAP